MNKLSKLVLNKLEGEKLSKQDTKLIVGGNGYDEYDPYFFIDGCFGYGCCSVLDPETGQLLGCTSFTAQPYEYCVYGK